MKDNKFVIRFISVLLISLVLGFASIYGARFATQYDLGQIAYMLVIFFPITAVATGVLAGIYLHRIWLAPIITSAAVLIAMFIAFKRVSFTYILIYMAISLVGYILTDLIRKILYRKARS